MDPLYSMCQHKSPVWGARWLRGSLITLVFASAGTVAAGEEGRRRPDPHRIVNESMNFLKEREPDLTAEESALYENARKQKPEFALKLTQDLLAGSKTEKPPSPAFYLLLGNLQYSSGAFDQAEASYRQAVDRYPNFLRAWTNLGTLYYAQKHYAKAVPCLAKAVTLGARESTTFGMMAECLEKTDDAVGAEVAYIQALASDPGNLLWMEGLLRVYLAAEQYPRAEVMLRKLIHEQPHESRHWLTYAKLMNASGRKLEAIALLEQALATGVGGDLEIMELAGLYADQQLVTEALQTYAKIKVTTASLGEERSLQLIRMLISGAEWGKAQALLDEIKPKVTSAMRVEWWLAQADLFFAKRNWAEARGTIEELLKVDPMNGRALVRLGRVYAAEGDWPRATMTFEQATQTSRGVRPASLELANLEVQNRHFEKSVSYLETALALEKNADFEQILERLRALAADGDESKM